jgi:integrase/recombinase XerD
MSNVKDGSDGDRPDLETGSKLATAFLRSESGATFAKTSAKTYASSLRLYVEFLENTSSCVLSAEGKDVRSYFKFRARQNRRENTLRSDLTAIKGLYRWIRLDTENDAQIDYLNLEDIEIGRYQTPPPIERGPLTKDELERLYEELETFRNRLMVTIGAELGPRNRDIVGIRIDDLDLENNIIELSDTKSGDRYKAPLSDELAVEIDHWMSVHRPTYAGSENHDFLFPSQKGGRLSIHRLWQIVADAAEEAGIQEVIGESAVTEREKKQLGSETDVQQWKKVTVHTLRHTFNYLMEEANLPPEVRRDALNHESTETTEEYYSKDSTKIYFGNSYTGTRITRIANHPPFTSYFLTLSFSHLS